MKVITTSKDLAREFKRLMSEYKHYYWSIAWADFDFEHSKLLEKYSNRIRKISVGLTFYGTDVNFLKCFKSHIGINFITDLLGTFHPKVYLFQNSVTNYEILIGSANFTKSAFFKNTEFCILIKAKDKNAKGVYEQTIAFINEQWTKGKVIDETFILNYSKKKSKLKPTPGLPKEGTFKPIYSKSWNEYIKELYRTRYQPSLNLLSWVDAQFKRQPLFHKMDLDTRKAIAGFGYFENISTGCFGSTNARGYFKNSIIDRPEIITKALSKIPKNGTVTRENYIEFINEFKKVSKQEELACASRMLCLWRPDYFVNFNGINADSLCKELRIKKGKIGYENYWNLIIEPLLVAEWSKLPQKMNVKEKVIYSRRIALLDCIHAKFER